MDFDIPSLGVDFAGFNLHKWMGAPLGVGFLYIRRGRLDDISRVFDDGDFAPGDIRSCVHSGSADIANMVAVPAAKETRLRHLRNRCVQAVKDLPHLQLLTPDDARLHAGITSIRLKGRTTRDDNLKLATRLREEFGLFTVRRGGVAAGDCVRISPALFNTPDEIDRLVKALRVVAA